MRNKLTYQQDRFCIEYIKCFENATEAHRRVFGDSKTANVKAGLLMSREHIKLRIEEIRASLANKVELEIKEVLMQWMMIARADPNSLIQNRRTCCHYCYGKGHFYQEIQQDYRGDAEPLGGFGFDHTKSPHPKCPVCRGEGQDNIFVADTRHLSGDARYLYAGVRRTKYGTEIIMRDQDRALENIAKSLGMFKPSAIDSPQPSALGSSLGSITQDPIEAA